MSKERERLVAALTHELHESNLAIFAGAGLSSGAGFVNWSQLLKPIADELDLDITLETDLVTLAQYHANANQANRGKLNQLLVTEFSQAAEETENHKILVRLPIETYWTTNYDTLIETALKDSGKVADIKYTSKQLALTIPKRDAVVYKMHGDVTNPADAILIRDDYEKYHIKMAPFVTALSGDLVSKTFLFLGFSFTDPNLEYILSRVRVHYTNDQRQHHCILRKVSQEKEEELANFEYRDRKQKLFLQELMRVGIKTTLVAEYAEITDILRDVEARYKQRTVFISGAAHEYGRWSQAEGQLFVYQLNKDIAATQCKVVSGFGLGVDSSVIAGVLEQIYMKGGRLDHDQLILRPFPQYQVGAKPLPQVWTEYREDMVNRAGIAIFVFGNKVQDGLVVSSNGMREEYEIAKAKGLFLVPIGITGYMAKTLWEEVFAEFVESKYLRGKEIKEKLGILGNVNTPPDTACEAVIEIIGLLKN
ncbi:hypothetical protein HC248_03313 [Polaromonas vacuolata]|uniref:NAD(+) hydrolase ThsA n=1 Tax=Polaromonas vacuolata TaxID=37448 RepID=A0A6H2HDL8_9BURK|nr:SIR2 family protein [Polaromonas vacuolata]QJC57981.1 hypothetical protein HC248_03313 [Polaromonas vacuolata]